MISSDTDLKLKSLLKEKYPDLDTASFFDWIQKHQSGCFIYPAALNKELHMDMRDIYVLMNEFVREEIAESVLEVFCPHCQSCTGYWYRTIGDVPDELRCPSCGEEIPDLLRNSIIVFRVL